jgi:hypothetical protein
MCNSKIVMRIHDVTSLSANPKLNSLPSLLNKHNHQLYRMAPPSTIEFKIGFTWTVGFAFTGVPIFSGALGGGVTTAGFARAERVETPLHDSYVCCVQAL